ncbi:MAG: hypothetical protein KGI27_04000 [Thaumarchaeota archaeon]|nr:hypothetical protein [Nitrososphaerota archaeon]
MQIPSNLSDPFARSMSEKGETIRQLFLERITVLVRKVPVKVMLGDGTISGQESFDPVIVRQFYESILRRLDDWSTNGVSVTTDQDLRRNFIKFEVNEDNYTLSCHMSLQYHALLYYKPDHKVINIQKELSDISDKIKNIEENTAPESDKEIEEKLKSMGYEGMDQQKLFEILFEHNELTRELIDTLQTNQKKINGLTENRDKLFKELDNLLLEIYHTTPVMIDEMKMIAAEEGCLCIFNLERVKNDKGEGNINLTRITAKTREKLQSRMDEIIKILKS